MRSSYANYNEGDVVVRRGITMPLLHGVCEMLHDRRGIGRLRSIGKLFGGVRISQLQALSVLELRPAVGHEQDRIAGIQVDDFLRVLHAERTERSGRQCHFFDLARLTTM